MVTKKTIIFLIFIIYISLSYAQMRGRRQQFQQCQNAPSNRRMICNNFHRWDRNARRAIARRQQFERNNIIRPPGFFQPNNNNMILNNNNNNNNNQMRQRNQNFPRPQNNFQQLNNQQQPPTPSLPNPNIQPIPQACMNLQCLCPYFRGQLGPDGRCFFPNGGVLQKSYRREIRMLSDDERQRYFAAVRVLKNNGEYDRLSAQHRSVATASGAHAGPAFLLWHREYVKRFEIALKLVDPSISVPYWDSVMDSYLPNPADSISFSALFFGESPPGGMVFNGPFVGFRTLEGQPGITRHLGREGHLLTEQNVNTALSQNNIISTLAYTAPLRGCIYPSFFGAIEYIHGAVHNWLGGTVLKISTSVNDPIFFQHHSFVDYLFEMWRQTKQNRMQRETDYPPDLPQCMNAQHFSNAIMRPFNIRNRDGLSNAYTDNMYSFAPRPTCSFQNRNCGSSYLFCDPRGYPHCVSKIKLGGICSGFEEMDACFGGVCVNGRCVGGNNRGFAMRGTVLDNNHTVEAIHIGKSTKELEELKITPMVNVSSNALSCLNNDPCCDMWNDLDECDANPNYMNKFCKKSCGECVPTKRALQKGCVDKHLSCKHWSTLGHCESRKHFMSENCQESCKLCDYTQEQICRKVAKETLTSKTREDSPEEKELIEEEVDEENEVKKEE
uniref:Tyrosinase_Cu-bd domain-containing protein n=1 Tax=Parastrongyloides trichosuri TaxID=131310 RepID=A0A0N4ZUJ2_PARTI